MADPVEPRYLLGGGELLSSEVPRVRPVPGDKAHPYSFDTAIARLSPQGWSVSRGIAALPDDALPNDEAVVGLTLHPSYLAKSYYPGHLLADLQLRHMGSRAVHIRPDKVVTQKAQDDPRALLAPLIYVAGDADRIKTFAAGLADWRPRDDDVRDDVRKIETLALPGADRLKALPPAPKRGATLPLEVVLHADPDHATEIEAAFVRFAAARGVKVFPKRSKQVGGLRFLAARGAPADLPAMLDFTHLRALRAMPGLAPFDPPMRVTGAAFRVALPEVNAAAPDLSVAIFDGGLPAGHGLDRWVTLHDAPGVGGPISGALTHGMRVTSAFLFGPASETAPLGQPPANVDHWRVYGDDTRNDDFELLPILDRIEDVLSSRAYDLVNISLGPAVAIDDDDVTRWTSTLDLHLAGGDTVATVACGNNGRDDRMLGLHRIQPPSDGVNMLAVGAADAPGSSWTRAAYSACGPGRSPGFVKPDLVAFGGSLASPFLGLDGSGPGVVSGDLGTSFASPLAMRCAAGVRAQFTEHLWAPTVKALLVHHARLDDQPQDEVGWGRLSHNLGDLVLCGDGEAHVVYQRAMPATGTVRLELPVPTDLTGRIQLKGTFCFFSEVDPEDTLNYTRGGLEIAFRPNSVDAPAPYEQDGVLIQPKVPKATRFFSSSNLYSPEFMRREDAHKWESTFSRTKGLLCSSLKRPVFDVSYTARSHGQVASGRPSHLKFALILTITQKKTPNLYAKVLSTSAGRLQPMRARATATVPIRLR